MAKVVELRAMPGAGAEGGHQRHSKNQGLRDVDEFKVCPRCCRRASPTPNYTTRPAACDRAQRQKTSDGLHLNADVGNRKRMNPQVGQWGLQAIGALSVALGVPKSHACKLGRT